MMSMKLSVGSQCVKYLMFIFNLLFVITGIILISMGSVIVGVYTNYQHFLDDQFLSVPNLLIATGVIIFFIAFFGCCGAVRESYCMIITFTSLLVLIFILEFVGGIFGYVLRDRVHNVLEDKMLKNMQLYNETNPDYRIWNEMQSELKCCGTNNSSDWLQFSKNNSLPNSCCDLNIGFKSCSTKIQHYETGCLIKLEELVSSHAIELGTVAIVIAFIQFVGILFSVYLARAIKRNYETV